LNYIPKNNSYLFYGYGPIFGISYSYREQVYKTKVNGEWTSDRIPDYFTQYYAIGIEFIVGVEYFINKSISIHGEYSNELRYIYTYAKQVQQGYKDLIMNANKIDILNNSVRFGCSFYL